MIMEMIPTAIEITNIEGMYTAVMIMLIICKIIPKRITMIKVPIWDWSKIDLLVNPATTPTTPATIFAKKVINPAQLNKKTAWPLIIVKKLKGINTREIISF